MSVMAFGLDVWAKVAVIHAIDLQNREPERGMESILAEVVPRTRVAINSNVRAFQTRYRGRYADEIESFTDKELLLAIREAIHECQKNPITRTSLRVGGGITYNCDEDPEFESVRRELAEIDTSIDKLGDS